MFCACVLLGRARQSGAYCQWSLYESKTMTMVETSTNPRMDVRRGAVVTNHKFLGNGHRQLVMRHTFADDHS